eukprot:68809-Alexandrium_andersonii.AAC.1
MRLPLPAAGRWGHSPRIRRHGLCRVSAYSEVHMRGSVHAWAARHQALVYDPETIALSSGEAELAGIVKGAAGGLGLTAIARDLGFSASLE